MDLKRMGVAAVVALMLCGPSDATIKVLGRRASGGGGGGSFTYISASEAQKPSTTGTSTTLAYAGSGVTAGSLLVVFGRTGSVAAQTYSITDTLGNTWVVDVQRAIQSDHTLVIMHTRTTSGGANTITFNQTSSASIRLIAMEFSGVATSSYTDGTAAATDAASGTTATSPSITTANDNSLVLTAVSLGSGSIMTEAGGATKIDEVDNKLAAQYHIRTPAGAGTESMTFSSDIWGCAVAGFKHS